MKKLKNSTRRNIPYTEQNGKRVLRLSQDTVRMLRSDELSQAVSGCDTTSWSTERRTAGC